MLAEPFFRAGFLQVSSKLGLFDFFGVNLLVSPTARELCTSLELSSFSMFVFLLRPYMFFVHFCFYVPALQRLCGSASLSAAPG